MGGPGGHLNPIDQNLGLVVAVQSSLPHIHGSKFWLKSLTFDPFCMKVNEKFQLQVDFAPDPPPALPLDPAGGSAPRPPFRLALRALVMVPFGKSWICRCCSPKPSGSGRGVRCPHQINARNWVLRALNLLLNQGQSEHCKTTDPNGDGSLRRFSYLTLTLTPKPKH